MDPAVKPAFEVWWLGHVGGPGLAGLVWFRRTSMLEPGDSFSSIWGLDWYWAYLKCFVEYSPGWSGFMEESLVWLVWFSALWSASKQALGACPLDCVGLGWALALDV